jgi:hypothetical protein
VLGAASDHDNFLHIRPSRGEKLLQLASNGKYPNPRHLEIHTGGIDNGCDPDHALRFCSFISGAKVCIVPESGHQLNQEYVRGVEENFLRE